LSGSWKRPSPPGPAPGGDSGDSPRVGGDILGPLIARVVRQQGVAIAATTFTDADPNGTVSNFTATINWGDGQVSPGIIMAGLNQTFSVTGSHTYIEEGIYPITVAITDVLGATATATSTGQRRVLLMR
jgi:hypothetical protein